MGVDYPGAIWLPQPDYTAGRDGHPIKYVIVHIAQGTAEEYLQNPNPPASTHYTVARDGKVYQGVREKDTAWQAGNWPINQQSIGIEHDGFNTQPWTDAEKAADRNLVIDICQRNRIPLQRGDVARGIPGLIPHREVCLAFGTCDHYSCPHPDATLVAVSYSWADYLKALKEEAAMFELGGSPAVASWGDGRLDIFARGQDGALWHRWYDLNQGGWQAWESLGGQLVGAPAVASWAPGRLDVFVQGGDGHLWQRYYDLNQGGWHAWIDLG